MLSREKCTERFKYPEKNSLIFFLPKINCNVFIYVARISIIQYKLRFNYINF